MFFPSKIGILALDIDGTLTADAHTIDFEVLELLNHLKEQWHFIFITGRPYQWGSTTLQMLPFPYVLAVQNGALLLDMPSKKILSTNYLSKDILQSVESICRGFETDFIVYTGLENKEKCYYRPDFLPPEVLAYVLERTAFLGEIWNPISSFSEIPVTSFSSVKCFAKKELADALSKLLEQEVGLSAPPIKDPFAGDYYVVLATHPQATKGEILKQYIAMTNAKGPIIAAGNDNNDVSMLEIADCKVVMADAPAHLLKMATIIAPPAIEKGIVKGLQEAIEYIKRVKGESNE